MASKSRTERPVNLTWNGMFAPEHFQRFPRGTRAALLHILKTLPDSLSSIDLRGDIKQALIGSGILHDCFGLSINGNHQLFLGLLKVLHELRGISPESSHRLNIFFDVEHEYLGLTS